jgi:hypothetical protein
MRKAKRRTPQSHADTVMPGGKPCSVLGRSASDSERALIEGGAAAAGVLLAVEPAVQVGPRSSRSARAVRDGQPSRDGLWGHGARRVPRVCAALPLVAPPEKTGVFSAPARLGPRARRAWWWRAAVR